MSNWHGAEERLAASGMRLAAKARGTGGSDRSCRSCKLRSETTKSRSAGSCKSLIMRCLTDSER